MKEDSLAIGKKISCDIKVSVVMPVYNAAKYLNNTMHDIFGQTYTNYEVICIDDGSTDISGELLDRLSQDYSNLCVIHQENQGGGVARNRGMKEARGKYLLFLDADDRFEPDLLAKVVSKAEETDCDVLAFGGDGFDSTTGETIATPWLLKGTERDLVDDPFKVVNTTIWNKLFLRKHIINHKLEFKSHRIADNTYFVFLGILYASKISIIDDVLVHYQMNNNESITSKSDIYPLDTFEALWAIKERIVEDGIYEKKKLIYQRFAAEYIVSRLHVFKTYEGFKIFYDYLHQGGGVKLGLVSSENGYEKYANAEVMKEIDKKSAEEYLFDVRTKEQKAGLLRKENYLLPDVLVKDTSTKIALYGGGNVGKDYFIQIMQSKKFKGVCWVDRNYERIGYPLQSPDVLKTVDFDVVVIAVLDEKTAKSIQHFLVDIGIPKDKIFWENPEVV